MRERETVRSSTATRTVRYGLLLAALVVVLLLAYVGGPWGTKYSSAQWEAFGAVALGFGAIAVALVLGQMEHNREESKARRASAREESDRVSEMEARARLVSLRHTGGGTSDGQATVPIRIVSQAVEPFDNIVVFLTTRDGVQHERTAGRVKQGSEQAKSVVFTIDAELVGGYRFHFEYDDIDGNRWRQDFEGNVEAV